MTLISVHLQKGFLLESWLRYPYGKFVEGEGILENKSLRSPLSLKRERANNYWLQWSQTMAYMISLDPQKYLVRWRKWGVKRVTLGQTENLHSNPGPSNSKAKPFPTLLQQLTNIYRALTYTRCCSRFWGFISEENRQKDKNSCPHEVYILVGKTYDEWISTQ